MKLTDFDVIENSLADFDFLENSESNVDMSTPGIAPYQSQLVQERTDNKFYQQQQSFNQPIVETETKQEENDDEPVYIVRKIFIDKFNQKHIRIELTPSVCSICGFDVCEKRHGRWGLVPASERKVVVEALAEHKKVVHTLGDLHIVKKSQLPKQWLGGSNHL